MRQFRGAGHDTHGADREVDVTDLIAIQRALDEHAPDAIVHLAAMSSVSTSWREPQLCYHQNFVGTRTLLAAARRACPDARVLLIGSADQYAATTRRAMLIDETTPLRARSPYARTKAAAELLGIAAARRGQNVVCVRAFNHTGAGQPDHFVASNFARQVAQIRLGHREPVMRVGNLESVRDFLHVDDVLAAYQALLDPMVPAGTYNVASGRSTSIQDVLDRLIEIAGIQPRIEPDPDRWRATDWLVGDATRLRSATGWRPMISLEAILHELYDGWLSKEGKA
jgi:GDP-4-dehydro-6-deoxy-D-mannose reductase